VAVLHEQCVEDGVAEPLKALKVPPPRIEKRWDVGVCEPDTAERLEGRSFFAGRCLPLPSGRL
jgi:hypothetical protein